jgi:pyruvate/2-oxoglutarate dehydrogenase complex dihydrolipoamide dehydrogenase (E3) component
MSAPTQVDAVVVGAGQAGGPLAGALAAAGRRTVLVERAEVGGACINTGCTPTKTMIASARVAWLAGRAGDYGVRVGDATVDLAAVRARTQAVVASFRAGGERRITATEGLELLRGDARFVGPRTLAVRLDGGEERVLIADLIVLDVGGRPALPDLPGFDAPGVLTSTTILDLNALPEHLIVVGGSYIALEFGQMFRRFGSRVTIVNRGERLLGREDPEVADAVADILREDGLDVLLATSPRRHEKHGENGVKLTVSDAVGERTLAGSHLLAATGRRPNTDTLALELAGVDTDDRGQIRVDEKLQTTAPGVYAVGDATGAPAFTHIAYDDFRILKANLLDGGDRTTADRPVPYTMFTDPQLGRIGLTETEARERGLDIRVASMPMANVARALEVGEPRGLMKAVVDADTGRILGAAILGIEGGELMTMLQIAMMGDLPYPALRDAVFAHPTLAESFNNLFAGLDG